MNTIEELFLLLWFVYAATFGEFTTDKRAAFSKLAEGYGITDTNALDGLYALTQIQIVELAVDLSRCNMIYRLIQLQDFKTAGERGMVLSDAELAVLGVKRRALNAVENTLQKSETDAVGTLTSLISAFQTAVEVGDTLAAGVLCFEFYVGLNVKANKKRAEDFAERCLTDSDPDGVLIALCFGGKAMQQKSLGVLKEIAEKMLIGDSFLPVLQKYGDITAVQTGKFIRT